MPALIPGKAEKGRFAGSVTSITSATQVTWTVSNADFQIPVKIRNFNTSSSYTDSHFQSDLDTV